MLLFFFSRSARMNLCATSGIWNLLRGEISPEGGDGGKYSPVWFVNTPYLLHNLVPPFSNRGAPACSLSHKVRLHTSHGTAGTGREQRQSHAPSSIVSRFFTRKVLLLSVLLFLAFEIMQKTCPFPQLQLVYATAAAVCCLPLILLCEPVLSARYRVLIDDMCAGLPLGCRCSFKKRVLLLLP